MWPAAEAACAASYLRRMAPPLLLPVVSVLSKENLTVAPVARGAAARAIAAWAGAAFPIMCVADGGHNGPRPWPLAARAAAPYLNVLVPWRNSGH